VQELVDRGGPVTSGELDQIRSGLKASMWWFEAREEAIERFGELKDSAGVLGFEACFRVEGRAVVVFVPPRQETSDHQHTESRGRWLAYILQERGFSLSLSPNLWVSRVFERGIRHTWVADHNRLLEMLSMHGGPVLKVNIPSLSFRPKELYDLYCRTTDVVGRVVHCDGAMYLLVTGWDMLRQAALQTLAWLSEKASTAKLCSFFSRGVALSCLFNGVQMANCSSNARWCVDVWIHTARTCAPRCPRWPRMWMRAIRAGCGRCCRSTRWQTFPTTARCGSPVSRARSRRSSSALRAATASASPDIVEPCTVARDRDQTCGALHKPGALKDKMIAWSHAVHGFMGIFFTEWYRLARHREHIGEAPGRTALSLGHLLDATRNTKVAAMLLRKLGLQHRVELDPDNEEHLWAFVNMLMRLPYLHMVIPRPGEDCPSLREVRTTANVTQP